MGPSWVLNRGALITPTLGAILSLELLQVDTDLIPMTRWKKIWAA